MVDTPRFPVPIWFARLADTAREHDWWLELVTLGHTFQGLRLTPRHPGRQKLYQGIHDNDLDRTAEHLLTRFRATVA